MGSSRSKDSLWRDKVPELRQASMRHYNNAKGKPLSAKAKADLGLLKQAKRVQ